VVNSTKEEINSPNSTKFQTNKIVLKNNIDVAYK